MVKPLKTKAQLVEEIEQLLTKQLSEGKFITIQWQKDSAGKKLIRVVSSSLKRITFTIDPNFFKNTEGQVIEFEDTTDFLKHIGFNEDLLKRNEELKQQQQQEQEELSPSQRTFINFLKEKSNELKSNELYIGYFNTRNNPESIEFIFKIDDKDNYELGKIRVYGSQSNKARFLEECDKLGVRESLIKKGKRTYALISEEENFQLKIFKSYIDLIVPIAELEITRSSINLLPLIKSNLILLANYLGEGKEANTEKLKERIKEIGIFNLNAVYFAITLPDDQFNSLIEELKVKTHEEKYQLIKEKYDNIFYPKAEEPKTRQSRGPIKVTQDQKSDPLGEKNEPKHLFTVSYIHNHNYVLALFIPNIAFGESVYSVILSPLFETENQADKAKDLMAIILQNLLNNNYHLAFTYTKKNSIILAYNESEINENLLIPAETTLLVEGQEQTIDTQKYLTREKLTSVVTLLKAIVSKEYRAYSAVFEPDADSENGLDGYISTDSENNQQVKYYVVFANAETKKSFLTALNKKIAATELYETLPENSNLQEIINTIVQHYQDPKRGDKEYNFTDIALVLRKMYAYGNDVISQEVKDAALLSVVQAIAAKDIQVYQNSTAYSDAKTFIENWSTSNRLTRHHINQSGSVLAWAIKETLNLPKYQNTATPSTVTKISTVSNTKAGTLGNQQD